MAAFPAAVLSLKRVVNRRVCCWIKLTLSNYYISWWGEPLASCLDLPSPVSFLFSGVSWVNVLLREGNRSNCLEYREDLGLFQEEQPSQMGTIFLVTASKWGIVREEPYQFRITIFSLLQGTMHLFGSVTTLGMKGGREWLHAMFQQPFFSANNGQ